MFSVQATDVETEADSVSVRSVQTFWYLCPFNNMGMTPINHTLDCFLHTSEIKKKSIYFHEMDDSEWYSIVFFNSL